MNQILYPLKDMDYEYFNTIHENLFKNMEVITIENDNVANLFTDKNFKYETLFIKYFGRIPYQYHYEYFLKILAQMMVDKFSKDETINKDYSLLLQLSQFLG
jgi:hypothetical protein